MLERLMKEFNLKHRWRNDCVHCCKSDDLYIQFIEPHSGTDSRYCLRADFPETFDRWGVALFEEVFDENEFDTVIQKLRGFIKNKDSIVKEEFELQERMFDE